MKIIDTKPKPFQRSSCNIWTDPYIQKQMLQEHLNPNSDAASRNWASILKIVDFINSHIRPASPIYLTWDADLDYMLSYFVTWVMK